MITQLIQIMHNYLNQCAIMLEIVYVLYYHIPLSGTRDLIFSHTLYVRLLLDGGLHYRQCTCEYQYSF